MSGPTSMQGQPIWARETCRQGTLKNGITVQDTVSNIAGAIEWTEGYVKDAIGDLPYASIVLAGISLILPLLKNPSVAESSNQEGFTYVTSQMRYYSAMEPVLLHSYMKDNLKADLTDRLVKMYKLIISFQVQTVLRFYRSRTKNLFRGTVKYDSWEKKLQHIKDSDKELVQKLGTAITAINLDLLKKLAEEAEDSRRTLYSVLGAIRDHVSFAQKMDRRMSNAENRACLQSLKATNPRDDKVRIERDKGGLLEDSYRWILENPDFQQWRDGVENRLLWIRGAPGKGKTMLLCGIIDELVKSTTYTDNISFFFCQATNADINNATAVLRGLIYMLVKQQPLLISHLRESYEDFGERRFIGTNAWVALSGIFFAILGDPRLQSTYLIVDALDECTIDPELFLELVQSSLAYPNVKWIVSSRNWPSIEKSLYNATKKISLHLELNEESVSKAVDTYIRFKVNRLVTDKKYSNDMRNIVQNRLLSNANGTFLWVALVCQELSKTSRWNTLSKLEALPRGLDALYGQMMAQIYSSDDAPICKHILAIVSTVYRPITLDELTSFVDISNGFSDDESLTEIIELCGSFLTLRERTVSFVHQSAKDFLIEKESHVIFASGIEDEHYAIFTRSLKVMSTTLRCDVYNLRTPGFLVNQAEQPDPDPLAATRYSCVYWVDHLLNCNTRVNAAEDLKDDGLVYKFLCQTYLFWLEALVLMRTLSRGIIMIRNLENRLKGKKSSTLYTLVHDAKSFALLNRSGIEETPLQIYCSALLFAPEKSVIRRQFESYIPAWIQIKPRVQADWSSTIQTLEGHLDWVNCVAFSLDGKQVVSGSDDKTVRVWDTETGETLHKMAGHSNRVTCVAFSLDGKQVVSGSDDKTVRVWDTETGAVLHTLVGHSALVNCVAFLLDDKQVVSSLGDLMSGGNTVRVWDTETGAAVCKLAGHPALVTCVAFSLDGKQVVFGSDDKSLSDNTVRVWGTETGAALRTLAGHSGSVTCVAFSPDGKQVVSGSDDETVRVWDAETGVALHILAGHLDPVTCVAFSLDGKQVVSGSGDLVSSDNTVRVWDTETGAVLHTLAGHSASVTSVAFSPDGKQVVFGSDDKTVRVWDTETGETLHTMAGHSNRVTCVAFSPDGKQVVSGSGDLFSSDNTVQVWDTKTGAVLHTLAGNSGLVTSVAFSPGGKQVVSGSWEKTVQVWNTETGAVLDTLAGHSGPVNCVAFSPDGKQVVSGSGDKTVRVWDTETGATLHILVGHSALVNCVAFSPDRKQVVSGSGDLMLWDNTVRVWDTETGVVLHTLAGHLGPVTSVAFSPDGKQVVSGSRDNTVRVWHTETGAALQTLAGHFCSATCVAFSPDGNTARLLVASSKWITEGKINLLWLPPPYRAACQAVCNKLIVVGHASGTVSIFGFKEGPKLICVA